MDPQRSRQDVVLCTLCKDAMAPMYCEVCHIHLCQEYVEKHVTDKSNLHKLVSLTQFLSSPKCPDHPTKQCELHCKQCDIPICLQCVISKTHKEHDVIDIMENSKMKQEVLRKDLQELEKFIFPKYQEFAAIIKTQKDDQLEKLPETVNRSKKKPREKPFTKKLTPLSRASRMKLMSWTSNTRGPSKPNQRTGHGT